MENLQIEGQYGQKPTLKFRDAQPPAELVVEVLQKGDGPEIAKGDMISCII